MLIAEWIHTIPITQTLCRQSTDKRSSPPGFSDATLSRHDQQSGNWKRRKLETSDGVAAQVYIEFVRSRTWAGYIQIWNELDDCITVAEPQSYWKAERETPGITKSSLHISLGWSWLRQIVFDGAVLRSTGTQKQEVSALSGIHALNSRERTQGQ